MADWKGIEVSGIDAASQPVTLALYDVTLGDALDALVANGLSAPGSA